MIDQKTIQKEKIDSQNISYTKTKIGSFDRNRHIEVDDAYKLIDSQADPNLISDTLRRAVEEGKIHIYAFNNKQYLDRFDIGRVYHNPLEKKKGIKVERYFSNEGQDPLDSVSYNVRHLELKNIKGEKIFEAESEFPESWDDNSARIVTQKYFFTPIDQKWKDLIQQKIGVPGENSIKHLIIRVANFFADKGEELGYFETPEDKKIFRDELMWLQINRRGAFNSPVQFNVGIYNEYGIKGGSSINFHRDPITEKIEMLKDGEYIHPQCHACFIKGPRDDLVSILFHSINEGAVFSAGSGIGQNIGALRESKAALSGGGKASGAISFLKIYDIGAGTIKSGGKSRRAARMTTMDQDHPDVMAFIRSKVHEDKKALALMKSGFEAGMDGDAYTTVTLQNTNISVRLDDYFFEQVEKQGSIDLISIKEGKFVKSVSADRMLKEIAFGSWRIGDPGIMYKSQINKMHTCPLSGKQKSSNPCGEYLFLDDTSCNLASLNLLEFSDEKGKFDIISFKKAVKIFAIVQDIANDAASYPIWDIAEVSPEFRTIGIGYANLGSLLMRRGLPYDSDEARALAGAITAIMTGVAYENSAELAERLGTFVHYNINKKHMINVMIKHRESLDKVLWHKIPEEEMRSEAYDTWDRVIGKGKQFGFRNAQTSVLAPTGTISYLLGSQDSTGIEPPISLIIYKDLAGGGMLKIANSEVKNALKNLEYPKEKIRDITNWIIEEVIPGVPRGTVIGAPHLNPDHYDIFNTAFGNYKGEGSISVKGHVKMMGAAQPFISGGISKTNNLPESATVKDIYDTFKLGHKLGLKGITVFRTNSKPISAMNFGGESIIEKKRGEKEDLPEKGEAFRNEIKINGVPFVITVGEYLDGRPGEVIINSYKAGSTLGGLLRNAGITLSKALKSGVDLDYILTGFLGEELDPKGFVQGHPYIKSASSPLDFLAKLLLLEYKGRTDIAQEPEKVDMKKLRGYRSGAFKAYRRRRVDDWVVDQVLEDPELGGFAEDKGIALENGNGFTELKNARGLLCDTCGRIMEQTAPNCYKCSCGQNRGGCGA
ncbi:MAG: vitamin B12-dependent ribonucleotide reductase [archaeon]